MYKIYVNQVTFFKRGFGPELFWTLHFEDITILFLKELKGHIQKHEVHKLTRKCC